MGTLRLHLKARVKSKILFVGNQTMVTDFLHICVKNRLYLCLLSYMMGKTVKRSFQCDRKIDILRTILHIPAVFCLQTRNFTYALSCGFLLLI